MGLKKTYDDSYKQQQTLSLKESSVIKNPMSLLSTIRYTIIQ